jgi:glycosyltransferase involved in cell wall biosynthesis
MRILVVSSYPPRHCGIGAYAKAQVERWRAEGNDVTVISPPDGDGDVRVPFHAGREFREAAGRAGDADRIVVHFQPGLHYRAGASAALSKILTSFRLWSLVRAHPSTEVLVHEATPHPPRWRPDHLLLRATFARASLLFHTEAERRMLEHDYGITTRARLVDHRDGVWVDASITKDEARRRLGLDVHELLFLCAGFLHPWKGYERAIAAFERADVPGRLAIVGSVRDPTATNLAYASRIREAADRTDRVLFVDGYVSDGNFDLWLAAADRLVLPYRRAWSSGALARARVLGTSAIVSEVGGLAEQAGAGDEAFGTDEQLVEVFRRVASSLEPRSTA